MSHKRIFGKSICDFCAFLWLKDSVASGSLGTRARHAMTIDVVTFDHAIERLAVNRQYTRRCLLVAAGVFQHTRNVTPFDDR